MPKRRCTTSLGRYYPNRPSHSLVVVVVVKTGGGCRKQVRPSCHILKNMSLVQKKKKKKK